VYWCTHQGFDALDYQEHIDYDLVQSTNPEFNKAIIRVNIYREHRQTIQVSNINLHQFSHLTVE
jgi:N-acetyltransferase 10